jgi:non-ribosomal peptide synthetase component F
VPARRPSCAARRLLLTLLYRYTGEPDILVGSPDAGRTHTEIETLIGLLPQHPGAAHPALTEPRFDDLLAGVRGTVATALAHQELPLENVLRAVTQPAADARAPAVPGHVPVPEPPEPKHELRRSRALTFAARDLRNQLGSAIFDLCLVMEGTERRHWPGSPTTAGSSSRRPSSACCATSRRCSPARRHRRRRPCSVGTLPMLLAPSERAELLAWSAPAAARIEGDAPWVHQQIAPRPAGDPAPPWR